MRFWLDCEFMEDGRTIEMLSIGIVSEDGREFYAENGEADLRNANPWVREHVFPHLEIECLSNGVDWVWTWNREHPAVMSLDAMGDAIGHFVGIEPPEFWGYFCAYDWVLICQTFFGPMINLPHHWPMICLDVEQLRKYLRVEKLPPQDSTEHIAIEDARWTKLAYDYLMNLKGRR